METTNLDDCNSKTAMDRIPNLDVNRLVVFYVIAIERSLSLAAERLCISEPAVSYHLKCLERSTGIKLIYFRKQKVFLTPDGESIFQHANDIYNELMKMERTIELIKESILRVGIGTIYIPFVAPVLMKLFEEQYPNIKLIIKSGNAFNMVEDVLNFNLDLAIVQGIDYGDEMLRYLQVSHPEELICFASPAHPLCGKKSVKWNELAKYPLITGPKRTVMHWMIVNKFKNQGFNTIPKLAAEVCSIEWGKKLVECGIGVSFSLLKDIEKEISEGKLKILHLDEEIQVVANAILRKDTYIHPAVQRFIPMIKQAFSFELEHDKNEITH